MGFAGLLFGSWVIACCDSPSPPKVLFQRLAKQAFPGLAGFAIATPLHVHNLDTLGLPQLLLVFAVLGVGVTSFVSATQTWRRRLVAGDAAPLTIEP